MYFQEPGHSMELALVQSNTFSMGKSLGWERQNFTLRC